MAAKTTAGTSVGTRKVEKKSGTLPEMSSDTLLRVDDLYVRFHTEEGIVRAVDGVTIQVHRRSVLGLVGESGCGKSVTALSIMQLLPHPYGRIHGGKIRFSPQAGEVVDITALKPKSQAMRNIRGNQISMIFQEPMTSLNPVLTVGFQIVEALLYHKQITNRKEAWERAVELLASVGIPSPAQRAREYPHQMSGGMRQRAMIAMALACNPALLIADEPTTALDVTIQAQILDLMRQIQDEHQRMSIVMITHNLGIVSQMCDDVAVMYLGRIVESADVKSIFANASHPYTIGLMNSIPRLGAAQKRLVPIKGVVPDPFDIPTGCAFRTRCPRVTECCTEEPPVVQIGKTHNVRCWLYA